MYIHRTFMDACTAFQTNTKRKKMFRKIEVYICSIACPVSFGCIIPRNIHTTRTSTCSFGSLRYRLLQRDFISDKPQNSTIWFIF